MAKSFVIPQKHNIKREDRNKLTGNPSFVIWFTGLSGSGKSTLANKLEQKLYDNGILTYILDGDNIRFGLNKDLDFSDEGRKENIRRISEVAKLMTDSGIVVFTAFISPFRKDRNFARELIGNADFIEIYVKCDIAVCEERDVKGLYSKARKGEINNFTGIDSPYEEPENPDLIIETSKVSIEESVEKIYEFIGARLKSH